MQRARYPCGHLNSKTIQSAALAYLSPVFMGKCMCKIDEEGLENAWKYVCRSRDACNSKLKGGAETVKEQARLSDKFTVLVNDISIAMKLLGYALYNCKVYKKFEKAKYTYTYKCDVEAFIHGLAGNELFKGRLLKDMKKIIDNLANPYCEVIRPLTVDDNLIEVLNGLCWSLKE
ncbi:hypothetical protein ACROYT_G014801 [Oculina patagonica]